MATEEFEYEALQDPDAIVEYLQALADGVKRGHLALASNGRELMLEPRGLIQLAVEAKRSKRRSRVVLKVSWRSDNPAEDREDPLRISSETA